MAHGLGRGGIGCWQGLVRQGGVLPLGARVLHGGGPRRRGTSR
ncbi:hypothetical protein C882_2440 [Caenispirillum salinarum AK4]|uniref:Uncharacterized protein n=1 Tax=Caenispirillum salinarum AK4 TaxID=1238182 RepID=K9HVU3_9PROT|nr:hypothetical protein C882_2440 [Caenispirillum salinarum AK4]